MEFYRELLLQGSKALLQLVTYPFYYIALLLLVFQYRRQIALERRLFQTRLHSLLERMWRTILWGIFAGVLASLAFAWLGAFVQPLTIVYIWIMSLIAILFRIRFLCLAYVIGLFGIVHVLLGVFPQWMTSESLSTWLAPIYDIQMALLLAVVAVLHVFEALFIRYQGEQAASPSVYESKRGRIVGGYELQQFWPVPLFLIIPFEGGGTGSLPWSPLFWEQVGSGGWTVVAFPLVMGLSALTLTRLPKQHARRSSHLVFGYAGIMLLLAIAVHVWPIMTLAASLASILLHEGIHWITRWDENRRNPLFVHERSGLKILAVLPRSAAVELGLQVGEVLHKVNGVKVTTKEQLHQALRLNPAFSKLEVINLQGHNKFVQRALFSGEHHQLGIVLAPDQSALYYMKVKESHLFSMLKTSKSDLRHNQKISL